MARMENNEKLNAFLSNDDNFEAVSYNDPRAVALRAQAAARNKRTAAAREKEHAQSSAQAATFSIGQTVKRATNSFVQGCVVKVEGENVIVDIGGTHRTFVGSALIAA